MNWNWGKAITVTYIVFAVVVIIHVIFFMTQKVELVTDNYYEKELKYQEQINRINNTKKLNEYLKVEYNAESIKLIFPKVQSGVKITGEIYFYKPSDAGEDFSVPVQTNEENQQIISSEKMQKGLWKIKISWEAEGVQYYNEETLML